jgi:hypothetical protein
VIENNVAAKIDSFVALLMHVPFLISEDGFLPLNRLLPDMEIVSSIPSFNNKKHGFSSSYRTW